MEDTEYKRVLDLSSLIGRIMLENGAEIYRVEDTMRRISAHFGIVDENLFVLTNGIFISQTDKEGKRLYAKVEHIPVHGAKLNRVIALNQLSRDICTDKITIDDAEKRIEEIQNLPNNKWYMETIATSVGAASFALLLQGNIYDALSATIAGIILGLLNVFFVNKYLSKVTGNILGAMVVTLICMLCHRFIPFQTNMNAMVAGSVIPLVPGVAFLNGIRDIADGDYISGAVRLLDAILVFTCIAVGVGIPLVIFRSFGGIIL